MTRSLHTPEYAAFVRILVEARKNCGLTQQDLAERLGKPQSYVAKVEGGERRLDVVEFAALARALDVDPSALFGRAMEAIADAQ
ncbi:helix-turn-helix domain-containing protein [Nitratireductor sp. CAU 1489]|uniref:Helix-turn-helix domain-containing protein n=1 Tax=Nitratireductor arenosus TaxID=2682096 RepID=A0A844QGG4_9HYPH|nr:helix-turn-helix transcriptional regulator [Nitratireductor arenosus]MVA98472.1 helix-turn-helix domain-containing protein [Nitratireductor arenosus]